MSNVEPPGGSPARPTPPPRAIVVAEENAEDLFLLGRLLKKCALANPIVTFSDAQEAIDFFTVALQSADDAALPCALLTDLKLIGGDGFEIIEWVRAQPRLQSLRIAIISGSENPAHQKRAAELRVERFYLKFPPADALAELFVNHR